jgi:phosphate transport system protein
VTRIKFDQAIAALKRDVDWLGEMAEDAVGDATSALFTGDDAIATAVIEGDHLIDDLFLQLEYRTYALFAQQQPVAGDLRFMLSALPVMVNWQRTGNLAVLLAKMALEGRILDSMSTALVRDMAHQATHLTSEARRAWREKNLALVRSLSGQSYSLDETYRRLGSYLTHQEPSAMGDGFQTLLAGRHLCEIGHNAIAVGDRVSYILTGGIRPLAAEIV